jgi:cytochrome bd ubiquinol oxidase subunit II
MSLVAVWYVIAGAMLAVYVVLDGFDFGVGMLHLFVARNDAERRAVLRSIGPVWDGNEVWLLAAGGSLLVAFPTLLATSFSGFYLPLIIVVWLLLFRALGIELRHQVDHPLWHQFWDVTFAAASLLLAVFFGAALGNVIRGVSLDAHQQFFAPLWTNFLIGADTGILDWYTLLVALTVTPALAQHGALWLAARVGEPIGGRALAVAQRLWPVVLIATVVTMLATLFVQERVMAQVAERPWGVVFPAAAVACLMGVRHAGRRAQPGRAFLASAGYLVTTLASAAFGIFPAVLPARDAALSLTIANAAAEPYGLRVALYWWIPGIGLALAYTAFVYGRILTPVGVGDASEH